MKIITTVVRLSYAHLLQAKLAPGATEAKFSCCVLIPKTDKAGLKAIEDAIAATVTEGTVKFGAAWAKGTTKNPLKLPLWDADLDDPKEGYAGCMAFNANNTVKPGIVDSKLQAVIDPDEVYSGMYARVSINFYPFDSNGNKGVAASLQNVMKVKYKGSEGERLDGKIAAEVDFAGVAQFDEEYVDEADNQGAGSDLDY